MSKIKLAHIFNNIGLVQFIREVTNTLYEKIKDDYININLNDIKETDKYRLIYATHKMNVLLDICRNSQDIKALAETNKPLYKRYIETLQEINKSYISILTGHNNYKTYKNEIINLYSGMKTVPFSKDEKKQDIKTKLDIKLPINTTLRPNQYYVDDEKSYYINFRLELDNPNIIPIIGNCYKKFNELFDENLDDTSEYEFLYFGELQVDITPIIATTLYETNYETHVNMYPVHYKYKHNTFVKIIQDLYKYDDDILEQYITNQLDNTIDNTIDNIINNVISTYFKGANKDIIKILFIKMFITFYKKSDYYKNDIYINEFIYIVEYLYINYIDNKLADPLTYISTIINSYQLKEKSFILYNYILYEIFPTYQIQNKHNTTYIMIDLSKPEVSPNTKTYNKYMKYKNKYMKLLNSIKNYNHH
jgi:hypothetical protein